uniref:Uncharacterized protein n=1 Tax=Glossina pallidipes TaxID=7398 RepID=A0A1B0A062_GLOPL
MHSVYDRGCLQEHLPATCMVQGFAESAGSARSLGEYLDRGLLCEGTGKWGSYRTTNWAFDCGNAVKSRHRCESLLPNVLDRFSAKNFHLLLTGMVMILAIEAAAFPDFDWNVFSSSY